MNTLSPDQIVFIHDTILAETGGEPGIRDLKVLQTAAAYPFATYAGQDLYPDLFTKAAALLDAIVHTRPFVDGNKRAGIAAAGLLLTRNGWQLTSNNEELKAFTDAVFFPGMAVPEGAAWLQAHSIPLMFADTPFAQPVRGEDDPWLIGDDDE